jgi:hypothetical protein
MADSSPNRCLSLPVGAQALAVLSRHVPLQEKEHSAHVILATEVIKGSAGVWVTAGHGHSSQQRMLVGWLVVA